MNKADINRKMSLSCDWDKVIAEEEEEGKRLSGQHRLSIFRQRGDLYDFVERESEKFDKPTVEFCTESSYTGQWDTLGMSGFGTYVFPHGVEYEGNFRDGMFHGEGTLTYPMGQKIEGEWINGTMVSFVFRFADGLEYSDSWDYCSMPDRRFFIEFSEGLRPAGREYLTNEQPTRVIPEGCYDTGRGFYDPKSKCITGALDSSCVYQRIRDTNNTKMVKVVGDVYEKPQVQIATESDEEWIVKNCRKAWDEPTRYRPDLYERWMSGREMDVTEVPDEASSNSSEEVDHVFSDFSIEQQSTASIASEEVEKQQSMERDDITKIWI